METVEKAVKSVAVPHQPQGILSPYFVLEVWLTTAFKPDWRRG